MAKKDRSKFEQKIDNFAKYVFLTKDGKPKSATMVYAFSLALLFTLVYLAAYLFLLGPLENLFASAPVLIRQIVEYLVPAIVGTIPCCGVFFAFRKNFNYVPLAYNFMVFFFILFLFGALLSADMSSGFATYCSDLQLYAVTIGIPAFLSVTIGYVVSHLLYRNKEKKQEEDIKSKNRPSYYNS